MSDYIEREAALQFVFDSCAECIDAHDDLNMELSCCDQCMMEYVKLKLRDMPAADVRPVVLCKDCKYGQGEKMDFWNEYEGIECIGGVVHRKDWFCADGEKREES